MGDPYSCVVMVALPLLHECNIVSISKVCGLAFLISSYIIICTAVCSFLHFVFQLSLFFLLSHSLLSVSSLLGYYLVHGPS